MSNPFKKPKMPKQQTPAQAPAPAAIETPARELGSEERASAEKRRKKGRKSLRIDPQTGGVSGNGGAGINVPMK